MSPLDGLRRNKEFPEYVAINMATLRKYWMTVGEPAWEARHICSLCPENEGAMCSASCGNGLVYVHEGEVLAMALEGFKNVGAFP